MALQKFLPHLAIVGAAFSYGSSYVPARSHEVHDGLTFGWYQCLGLLLTGSAFALGMNDWSAPVGTSPAFYVHPEGLVSGVFYQLANVFATLAVSKVGLGVYYTVHEFPNVGATLVLGFLGPKIGFPCRVPANFPLALFGAFLVGVGMIPTMLMEEDVVAIADQDETSPEKDVEQKVTQPPSALADLFNQDLQSPLNPKSAALRDSNSHSWSHFAARFQNKISRQTSGSGEFTSMLDVNSQTWDGSRRMPKESVALLDVFAHVTHGLPSMPVLDDDDEEEDWTGGAPSAPELETSASHTSDKVLGIVFSLIAGLLYGVMFAPMPLWQQRMKAAGQDASASHFVFAVCLGSSLASTGWLVFWSTVKKYQKKKLDKSVLRPALAAGGIYYVAMFLEFYAMAKLPYAVAYVGTTGLALSFSMGWGIFVFGEMKTAHNRLMAAMSFTGVISGAACLALAG